MRNLKKLLALVLAVMMTLSVVVFSASAADDADYTEAAQHLASLQVMKGNENGDLMLENGVTRYQAALFFVQALTGKTDVAVWNADKQSANFTDVPEYGTAIDYAYGLGIVKGRGNGVYGYNDAITYQDMLVMAVRALGYETKDMSYPYGYILAAQKLGLTENVEQVNYKAALNRGETAQIIWDMLGTEIAVVDPLTDKVLYPGETGLTDAITDTATERVTLLEDSGLAGGKVDGVIVDFVEADEDDEESFDVVTVDVDGIGEIDFAAADFGIDADTRFVDYMGLPVEIFISVDEEDFTQEAYDDEDAAVVFASFPEYTAVVNLGAAGNIKYVASETEGKSYFSFGGVKFTEAKYEVEVYAFVDGIWTVVDVDLAETFAYDSKDGYADDVNTYAQVAYRVVDRDDEEFETDLVEVLYTPFTFGQYNVREINGVKYTVVATYEDATVTNLDEVDSHFVEYLVDGAQKVTVSTKSISNKKGEAAATVTVEGVAVEAGDFMFYAYNETDNVLSVAMNCGTFQTGRLTAQNSTKETVKISGTNYEVGFVGYVSDWSSAFDADTNKAFISALESGKDNVEFLVVDGNVVYMAACSETTNDSKFDFAIVTTDVEIMADLLDMTETKYENALVEGLYIADGAVKVAMMDKTTGEWVLASIDTFVTDWVAEDEEFENEYDLANEVKYTDLIGADYKNADAVAAFAALVENGIVAVIEENNGVYTIAENEDDFFVYGTTEDGILFSDTSAKTNAITADDDVDAARVTLTDNSVVIVVAGGIAGSRVGVQGKNNSVEAEGYFLAASADLIVFVTDDAFDVADWADAKAANSDENWYITTLTTGVEIEAGETEDDPYVVTITDVYDMKAMAMVDSIQTEVEDIAEAIEYEGAGIVLFKNASGEIALAEDDFIDIIAEVASDNEAEHEYVAAEAVEFIDAETIVIDDVTTKAEAFDINVKVVTLDMTGLDTEDYDLGSVVSNVEWADGDEDNDYNVGDVTVTVGNDELTVWEYALDADLVNEITEPTEGIFDQYVIDFDGTILVPAADSDDYADAIEVAVALYVVYDADAIEDGVVNMVVYKVLTLAD